MIHTYGVTALTEQKDSRQWGALESGGQTLSTRFLCRTADAQTYRASLLANGHPEFPGMVALPEDVTIEESLTGIAKISATFGGQRTTTTAAARIAITRPINAAQYEYEIVTIQNYLPRISDPQILNLAEIASQTYDTQVAGTETVRFSVRFTLAPVLESCESRPLGASLYECRYFLTLREVDSVLLQNGQPATSGIPTFHGYTSAPKQTFGAGSTVDPVTVLPSIPTTQIRLAALTLSDGLDRQAARFGLSVRRFYYRATDSQNNILYINSNPALILPSLWLKGPPRILPEANPDNTPETTLTFTL